MFPMGVNTLCIQVGSRPTLQPTGHVISNYTTLIEGQTTQRSAGYGGRSNAKCIARAGGRKPKTQRKGTTSFCRCPAILPTNLRRAP